MRLRKFVSALIPLTGLFIAGCTTFKGYEGTETSPEEVAVISTSYFQETGFVSGEQMLFTGFDGIPIEEFPYTTKILMAPGKHEVAFVYRITTCFYISFCDTKSYYETLRFEAKPGNQYELDGEISGNHFWSWVVDKSMGVLVVGQIPTETPSDMNPSPNP
jgi:hypothetical protein